MEASSSGLNAESISSSTQCSEAPTGDAEPMELCSSPVEPVSAAENGRHVSETQSDSDAAMEDVDGTTMPVAEEGGSEGGEGAAVGEEDDDELRVLLAQVRKTLPLEEGEIMDADRRTEVMDLGSESTGGNESDEELPNGNDDDTSDVFLEGDDFNGEHHGGYDMEMMSEYMEDLAPPAYYGEAGGQEWTTSTTWTTRRGRGGWRGRRGNGAARGGRQGGRGAFSGKPAWRSGHSGLTDSSGWVGEGYGDNRSYFKSDPALVINLTESDLESSASDSEGDGERRRRKKVKSPFENGSAALSMASSLERSGDLEKELMEKKKEMQKLQKLLAQKRKQKLQAAPKETPPSTQEALPSPSGVDVQKAVAKVTATKEELSLQAGINRQTEKLADMARQKKALALKLQQHNVDVSKFLATVNNRKASVRRLQSLLEKAEKAVAAAEAELEGAEEKVIRVQLQATQLSRNFEVLEQKINEGLGRLMRMEATKKSDAHVVPRKEAPATKEEKLRQLQELLEQEKSLLKDKQVSFIQEQKSRVKNIASNLRLAENVRLAKLSKAAAAEETAQEEAASNAQKMRRRKLKQEQKNAEREASADSQLGGFTTVPLRSLGGIMDVPMLLMVSGTKQAPSSHEAAQPSEGTVTFATQESGAAVSRPAQERERDSMAGRYISPLQRFRAYRFSPYFKPAGSKLLSPEMTIALDPLSIVCRFELHGTCNDPDCPWQHIADQTRTPSEALQYLADLAQRRDGGLPPAALEVLKKASRFPAEMLAKELVAACNDVKKNCHYLPLQPPAVVEGVNFRSSKTKASGTVSSAELLGMKAAEESGEGDEKDELVLAADPAAGARELRGLDTVPMYDISGRAVVVGEKAETRYYLSKKGKASISDLLRKDIHDVGLWITYALQEQDGERDVLVVLRRLARAVENNSSSVELWSLYMKYFFKAGKHTEARQLLEKATTDYVPLSFTLWHLRWVFSASVAQKLSISVAAVEQFSAAPDDTLEPRQRSAILLNLLLSFAFVLVRDGKTDFVQRRLTYFLLNAASPSITAAEADAGTLLAYPSVGKFLATPAQAGVLWALLVPEDQCTVVLQLAHLIMAGDFPLTAASFYSYIRPFAIDWSTVQRREGDVSFEAKRMLTSAIFKAVAASLEASPSEMVSFYSNYVAFELAHGGFAPARAVCQAQLSKEPHCPELVALYAETEMLAAQQSTASSTPLDMLLTCFGAPLRAQAGNSFLWHRFVGALLHIGEKGKAVSALVASVAPHSGGELSLEPVQQEAISAAQKRFCHLLKVEFRGEKEADELLSDIFAPLGESTDQDGDAAVEEAAAWPTVEEDGAQNDVFIWLNFLSLLSLTAVKEDVCHVFCQGLLQLTDHHAKTRLLEEYFKWRCGSATSEDIFQDLDRFAEALGPVLDSPLEDEISPDLRDGGVHRFLLPAPAENYAALEQVSRLILARFPARRCVSILQLLVRRFPRNSALHIRLGGLFVRHGRFSSAQRSFVAALKICPQLEHCWLRLLELELEQETKEADLRFLFQAALRALPESFALWGKYQEFEMAQALTAKQSGGGKR